MPAANDSELSRKSCIRNFNLLSPRIPPPINNMFKTEMFEISCWVGVIFPADSKLLTVPRICNCFESNRNGVSLNLSSNTHC
jgi:hypothetical protein